MSQLPHYASPFSCLHLHQVEGSHGNDGLLLGRPLEEPDQPIADKSLLEIIDGIVMMYNLSVHQQLGKVSLNSSTAASTAVSSNHDNNRRMSGGA